MKNFVLAAVVFAASSVSAFADTIVNFSDLSVGSKVKATASATGTVIQSGLNGSPSGIAIGFGGGVNNVPNNTGFITFSLASTGVATTFAGGATQSFAGDFKITQNANGTGTVYVQSTGNALSGTIFAANGTTSFQIGMESSSDFTGTLIAPGIVSPFGLSLQFSNVSLPFSTVVIGGKRTIRGFTSVVNGTVTGVVPEPSTISLLGLGVAGLAFGAYRQIGRAHV